jgi:hypothetical protein
MAVIHQGQPGQLASGPEPKVQPRRQLYANFYR